MDAFVWRTVVNRTQNCGISLFLRDPPQILVGVDSRFWELCGVFPPVHFTQSRVLQGAVMQFESGCAVAGVTLWKPIPDLLGGGPANPAGNLQDFDQVVPGFVEEMVIRVFLSIRFVGRIVRGLVQSAPDKVPFLGIVSGHG